MAVRPCIVLCHAHPADILTDVQLAAALRAQPQALVELRCERWPQADVQLLQQICRYLLPERCVVTCRGVGQLPAALAHTAADKERQQEVYRLAVALQAAFVDVDGDVWCQTPSLRQALLAQRPQLSRTRFIVSQHAYDAMPQPAQLQTWRDQAIGCGADVVKIAVAAPTLAAGWPLWQLACETPAATATVLPVLMGDVGLYSRILSARLPAPPPLTYVRLDESAGLAAGQPTLTEAASLYRLHSIEPQTPVWGVLGAPLGHSRSPWLHNRLLQAWRKPGVYLPFAVAEAPAWFLQHALGTLGICGLSVTLPHKSAALAWAQQPSQQALRVGAANTLYRVANDQLWAADNTDVPAAAAALAQLVPQGLHNKQLLLLGAGGASRALAAAAQQAGAHLHVCARRAEQAQQLAADFAAQVLPVAALTDALPQIDGVLQGTSVGMQPHAQQSLLTAQQLARLPSHAFVYDAIYTPRQTQLAQLAQQRGLAQACGEGMFLRQAALQCQHFYGRTPSDAQLRWALGTTAVEQAWAEGLF